MKGVFQLAHVAKYTRSAMGHMLAHYDRSANNISNPNIQPELTDKNYNLAPERDIPFLDFVQQRCNEVNAFKRKDVNVICDWVVTAPKELPTMVHEQFFKETYNFLCERYGGEKNVVSAYVHVDEKQPHLHFCFMPIFYDATKEKEKLSAKQVITRSDLNSFHSDLEKHLQQAFMYTINVQNGATRGGNKSIKELQRETAQAELASITSELERFDKYNDLKLPTIKLVKPEKNLFGKTSVPYDEYQGIVEDFKETLEAYKEALNGLNKYKIANISLNRALEDATTRLNELNNKNPYEELKELTERLNAANEEKKLMTEEYFETVYEKTKIEDLLNWHNGFYESLIEKLSKLNNTELSYVYKLAIPNEYINQIRKDVSNAQEKEIQQSKDNQYDLGFEL